MIAKPSRKHVSHAVYPGSHARLSDVSKTGISQPPTARGIDDSFPHRWSLICVIATVQVRMDHESISWIKPGRCMAAPLGVLPNPIATRLVQVTILPSLCRILLCFITRLSCLLLFLSCQEFRRLSHVHAFPNHRVIDVALEDFFFQAIELSMRTRSPPWSG